MTIEARFRIARDGWRLMPSRLPLHVYTIESPMTWLVVDSIGHFVSEHGVGVRPLRIEWR